MGIDQGFQIRHQMAIVEIGLERWARIQQQGWSPWKAGMDQEGRSGGKSPGRNFFVNGQQVV